MQKAVFGLGCFWGPDDYFSKLKGVKETVVGYAGGTKKNPNYDDLGDHTEVIKITFDETVITYKELLDHFWKQHDATATHKTQYQSIILATTDEQLKIAKASKAKHKGAVTKVRLLETFTKAEEYHQKYFQKHKVAKFLHTCGI